MKIALLVNSQTPETQTVVKVLKELNYTVLKTSVADEVSQAGKQANKLVLVFDDAKLAYRFCGENISVGDFEILKILFLGRKPIMTAEVSQKLESVGLKLFILGEEEALRKKIVQFESASDVTMDLEFSIIDALEKEK